MTPRQPNHEKVAKAWCGANSSSYLGFIGLGAFKETYKVQDKSGHIVALKLNHPGNCSDRHKREIEAMKSCNHPSICRLLNVGSFEHENSEYYWSIEEFLDGGTLTSRIESEAFNDKTKLKKLAIPIASALEHLYALSLVHRDIKPDNIMFRKGCEDSILVDFGLVRNLGASSLTPSWLIHGPGTPLFSSPEQLNNEKSLIDWRSDQFSLGVVLSMAAFGLHPFQAKGELIGTAVQKVFEKKSYSHEFEEACRSVGLEILTKMVSPWPVQRFRLPLQLRLAWESL